MRVHKAVLMRKYASRCGVLAQALRLPLLFAAASVAACASNGNAEGRHQPAVREPSVTVGEGIARVRLGASDVSVRRLLGRPDAISRQSVSETGDPIWEWKYRRARLTVDFRADGARKRVLAVATRSPRYRSSQGLGVGSSSGDVRRAHLDCGRGDADQVWCTVTADNRQTILVIAGGRVIEVRITKVF